MKARLLTRIAVVALMMFMLLGTGQIPARAKMVSNLSCKLVEESIVIVPQ